MKKINYLLILLLMSVALSNCHKSHSVSHSKREINKIVINWLDFDLETDIRIDCDQFTIDFDDSNFTTSLSAEKEINFIVGIVRTMKRIDNAYQPDVRGKMRLYHSNNLVDTICFSDIVLKFKNDSYKTPPELINFLLDKNNQLAKKENHQ